MAPTRTLRVAGAQHAGYGEGQGPAGLRSVVAAARGEAESVFPIDDPLRVLVVLSAVQRSNATGERVRLGCAAGVRKGASAARRSPRGRWPR